MATLVYDNTTGYFLDQPSLVAQGSDYDHRNANSGVFQAIALKGIAEQSHIANLLNAESMERAAGNDVSADVLADEIQTRIGY